MKAIDEARLLLRQGRLDEAERVFRRVLRSRPEDVDAYNGVAMAILRAGEPRRALAMLEQACERDPNQPLTQHNLGRAHDACGHPEAAARHYRAALRMRPELYTTRLWLGELLDRLGDAHGATLQYARALRDAQSAGRWLDPQSTPPGLVPRVEAAVRRAESGRRDLVESLLAELRSRHGGAALARFEHCVRVFLGEEAAAAGDLRRPRFLLFPALPAEPFLPMDRFAGLGRVVASADEIRAEFAAFERGSAPIVRHDLIRDGRTVPAALERCPRTVALLEDVALARIRDHAPQVTFTSFAAGVQLRPTHGVTNTRVVAQLVLDGGGDAGVRVAAESRSWARGELLTFDESFEHEFWNRSDRPVDLLVFDLWHPALHDAERLAVAELIAANGDFSRAMEAA